MNKNLFSLALFIPWAIGLQAQDLDETPIISPSDSSSVIIAPAVKKIPTNDKLNYNLSAGTSFISAKGFGSGMASYVAPEVSYKLSPKIKINAGVMFINSNFAVARPRYFVNEQSVVIKTKPTNSAVAYVEGDYLVNSRLSVSAMIMKDVANNQNSFSGTTPVQSMSVHMNYKITDNITFGAGMHINQGSNFGYPYPNYNFGPAHNFNPLTDF